MASLRYLQQYREANQSNGQHNEIVQLVIHDFEEKLGIDDPYYFSRLFSHIMGLSPKAYRQRPKA